MTPLANLRAEEQRAWRIYRAAVERGLPAAHLERAWRTAYERWTSARSVLRSGALL